jgi:hypothetical protein
LVLVKEGLGGTPQWFCNPRVTFDGKVRDSEEWPKSAPFFFSATLLAVLNPSFFWGVQMEFSIQNEINSFHLFCNTIRLL